MPADSYSRLGVPGNAIADPKYLIEYKDVKWGTHKVRYPPILFAVQLQYALPSEEMPAYLLNHAEEEITIRRLAGNKAAETITLQELYQACHGSAAWESLKDKAKGSK